MAIQSPGEFEIILNTIITRVLQRLSDQPNNRKIITAKRAMEDALAWAAQGHKPNEKELASFAESAESIRQAFRDDTALSDKLFDLLDFLEYRA